MIGLFEVHFDKRDFLKELNIFFHIDIIFTEQSLCRLIVAWWNQSPRPQLIEPGFGVNYDPR
jgi:hypothetical protein